MTTAGSPAVASRRAMMVSRRCLARSCSMIALFWAAWSWIWAMIEESVIGSMASAAAWTTDVRTSGDDAACAGERAGELAGVGGGGRESKA